MKNFPLPIRYTIPVVVLILGALIALLFLHVESSDRANDAEQEIRNIAIFQGTETVSMLEYLLRKNDMDGATLFINQLGANPHLRKAIVFDEQDSILISTRYSDRRQILENTLTSPADKLVQRVRQSQSYSIARSDDTRSLVAVYPFMFPPEKEEIRPLRVGTIYFEYDLSYLRTKYQVQTINKTLSLIAMLSVFSFLVWGYFHLTLAVRAGRLVETTRQIGSGNFRVHTTLQGQDELAGISEAVNEMAHNLVVQREVIRENEEQLRVLFENMSEGFAHAKIITDEGGKPIDWQYITVNPAFEAQTGLEREKVVGRKISEILPGALEDAADWVGRYGRVALSGERDYTEDFSGPLKKWYAVRIFCPKIGEFAATFYDITDRKQAEQQIRTLNAELEERVRQRTAELESANKDLQDVVYATSHDLKTPLRGISRLAYWLTRDYAGSIDERGKEMAAMLISRVKRLDRLLDGILAYTSFGGTIDTNERIALHVFVQELIEELSPPEHVQITLRDELPAIIGNKSCMTQIFQHLLMNAIQAIDKPEGKIMIGCLDEGSHWRFSVTDNGSGIDPKYHAKIFQFFQTLRPRDKYERIGIGLALVKKIVESLGGTIWLESTPGQGSTFFFRLTKKC